jgi:hypothetical protein
VGPLKKAKGGFKYIFIAIDKFTKWIEYKPLLKYSAAKVVEFIQESCIVSECLTESSQTLVLRSQLSSSEVGHKTAG